MDLQEHLDGYRDYLIRKKCSKTTIINYLVAVKQFLAIIKKEPEKITQLDLDKFDLSSVKNYQPNTLTPKYSAVNQYMEFINKRDKYGKFLKLKRPKQVRKNKIPFTQEEIQQLFEVSKNNLRDNALIKVFYYGLLRKSEVINLNIEDIDFERQKVIVNAGKGNKHSTINLHPDALSSIQEYLKIRRKPTKGNETALFLNSWGWRIGTKDINYTIKKYASILGLKKRVYPHLFRISGITHMYLNDVGLEDIRKQSRHCDYSVIMGYIQLSDEQSKEAYMKGFNLKKYDNITTNEQKPEMKKSSIQPQNQVPNAKATKDLELRLIERLANGEISSEIFSQAIQRLDTSKKQEEIIGYW